MLFFHFLYLSKPYLKSEVPIKYNFPLPSEGFPGGSDGKESACNMGDLGSIPGSGRFPGGGRGNPLQSSCLETPMERGAWRATVHGVKESDTTEQLSTGVRARWGLGDPVLRNLKSWSWRQAEQGWHFPHFHREVFGVKLYWEEKRRDLCGLRVLLKEDMDLVGTGM